MNLLGPLQRQALIAVSSLTLNMGCLEKRNWWSSYICILVAPGARGHNELQNNDYEVTCHDFHNQQPGYISGRDSRVSGFLSNTNPNDLSTWMSRSARPFMIWCSCIQRVFFLYTYKGCSITAMFESPDTRDLAMKFFWATWMCPLTDDGDTQFTYGTMTSGKPMSKLKHTTGIIIVNMKVKRVVPNMQAYAHAVFNDHLQGGS